MVASPVQTKNQMFQELSERGDNELALTQMHYTVEDAAQALDIHRTRLYYYLNDPDLDIPRLFDVHGKRFIRAQDIKAIWMYRHNMIERPRKKRRMKHKRGDTQKLRALA